MLTDAMDPNSIQFLLGLCFKDFLIQSLMHGHTQTYIYIYIYIYIYNSSILPTNMNIIFDTLLIDQN